MPTVAIDAYRDLIGQPLGTSDWLTVSQDMIDRFADATGDHQFIHVDPERAAATPFGGTIAHGFLSLSLMSALYETTDMPRPAGIRIGVNYGGDKTRFLTPVRSNKRVRAHFRLLAFDEKQPGRYQQTIEYVLEIEGEEKPALVSEWIMLFFT
ncbi:MaoC family dehydratase [Sphingomonas flavalba]|uniref:MaoC family dehydratase n=1 Tax=Sphingomonas flavalba TaxID=2559804 RepID=UPI0039DFFFFE